MIKALIFDLDGTLIHLILPLEKMRDDTKSFFIQKGLPESVIESSDGISSTKLKAKDFFSCRGLTPEDWASWCTELDEVLDLHEARVADQVSLIDGSIIAVIRIRELGFQTAILTNSGRRAVDVVLSHIPLAEHFEVIRTRSEVSLPKPYPNGLLEVTESLGLTTQEVIYVGDSPIDVMAATKAGIEFWGVTTGENDSSILLSAGAKKVFASLIDIFDELKGSSL